MAQQSSVQMDENLVQQLRLLIQTEFAALKSGATGGSSSQLPSGVATLSQTGSVVSGGTEPPSKRPKKPAKKERTQSWKSPACPVMMRMTIPSRCQRQVAPSCMETDFKSKMNATSRRKKMGKLGLPDCKWTKSPELDALIAYIKNDNTSQKTQRL